MARKMKVLGQYNHLPGPTIPSDFSDALKTAGLAEFFAGCTSAHKKEYLKWIAEAKRPETRQARITKAIRMLSHKCAEETAQAKNG
jgi:uncharacterized protein YdeI (YjbR/CyaY-like superfamily)